MMLMLMMLFECTKEKIGEAPERSHESQNPGSTDQPAQPPVPSWKVKVTIPIKYLHNFQKSLHLSLMN